MTTLILIALVLGLLAFIAKQPAEFKIVRMAKMSASPDAIFPHVNNLQKWDTWSPWAKMDPAATRTFAGPEAGVGASTSWAGNKTGEGTMTITESNPSTAIKFRLDFKKPMTATNQAEFTFTPDGAGTLVTWCMSGNNSFMGKAVGLVMNCDKMVGGQFDQGLADLKSIVEK